MFLTERASSSTESVCTGRGAQLGGKVSVQTSSVWFTFHIQSNKVWNPWRIPLEEQPGDCMWQMWLTLVFPVSVE